MKYCKNGTFIKNKDLCVFGMKHYNKNSPCLVQNNVNFIFFKLHFSQDGMKHHIL